MEDPIRKMVDLTVGFMSLSREKVVETAKQWAEEKKFTPAQTREFIQTLLDRGEQDRAELQQNMQDQVGKTLERIGLRENKESIHAEIASLKALVVELGSRIEQLETSIGGAEASKSAYPATTTLSAESVEEVHHADHEADDAR